MLIGGFVPFSLIDYPPRLSCVVFTRGCNLRCPYCHNPELIPKGAGADRFLLKPFFEFLRERRGKLDAVVITGGEPTLQEDLVDFITQIHSLNYAVKLDTNGTNPALLERLIDQKLIAAVAVDIKGPLSLYQAVTGTDCDRTVLASIESSIRLVMRAEIEYEFRTTVVKDLLSVDDIMAVGTLLKGAKRYVLQRFVPSATYNPRFAQATSLLDEEFTELRKKLESEYVAEVIIR